MSDDSSRPLQPRPKVETIPVAIQTIATGLLLYLVPPTIAAFALIVLLKAGGMSGGEIETWFQDATVGQFLYVLITETIVIGFLWLLVRHAKLKLKDIGVARPKPSHIQYVVLGLIVYFAAYVAVATLVSVFTNINLDQEQEIGFNTNVSGFDLVLAGVSLIVLPPIVEEVLFRGYLYNRFRQGFSVVGAGLLVSLLFGAAHLQIDTGNIPLWIAAIDTFILSVVLVYIREKTGTIWAGVCIHALKNALAFVILFNIFS
jgi:membrane protease YdiL (CAAX protease family)